MTAGPHRAAGEENAVTHRFALTLLLTATLAATAAAQEHATVLKRDGTRVTGRFEAWNRNNNALYLRVTPGDQRIIPLGETAMLEVEGDARTLPAYEIEAAKNGDHVLVLRSGEIVARSQNSPPSLRRFCISPSHTWPARIVAHSST